jgi:CheY-like chemotaxis protein
VEERTERLRRVGHEVIVPREQNSPGLRAVRDDPPDVFLVDLDRRPSHGREVAQWLRQSPKTRPVPIVFAGGDEEKTARVLWPKKASGVTTDLTQEIVRATGLRSGLVDYKIAAIDATWSGLRFARREPVRR